MGSLQIALQLYSVRDHMEKDAARTLKKVKAIGYDHVEVAGLYGLEPTDYQHLLDDAGLRPISMHVSFEELAKNLDSMMRTATVLGLDYLVVSWIGGDWAPDGQKFAVHSQVLEAVAAKLSSTGVHLCYHNHDIEMKEVGGKRLFDLIFENAPVNLAAQIDTAWVQIGGGDPVALIQQYAGKCPLLHIKDYDPPRKFVPVGQGCMDWPPIIAAGKEAGAEWFIVEQDDWDGVDSLECARISAEFLERF